VQNVRKLVGIIILLFSTNTYSFQSESEARYSHVSSDFFDATKKALDFNFVDKDHRFSLLIDDETRTYSNETKVSSSYIKAIFQKDFEKNYFYILGYGLAPYTGIKPQNSYRLGLGKKINQSVLYGYHEHLSYLRNDLNLYTLHYENYFKYGFWGLSYVHGRVEGFSLNSVSAFINFYIQENAQLRFSLGASEEFDPDLGIQDYNNFGIKYKHRIFNQTHIGIFHNQQLGDRIDIIETGVFIQWMY
jgi:hypothetical protein